MKKFILSAIVSFALTSLTACANKKAGTLPTATPEDSNGLTPPLPPSDNPSVDENFEKLKSDVAFYKSRYQMPDIFNKITDNKGNNFEDLYGTRNMREVLAGVYYRGGANNRYHRKHPRNNSNPLPSDGLDNLCKDGFSTAFYFYSTNYNTAKPVNPCRLRTTGEDNILKYNQLSAFNVKDFKPFLQIIHDRIKGKLTGPIYGHCWNGWHASGLMAAIVLKQFCQFSNEQADSYWVRNTDGNSFGFAGVRSKIKNFVPIASLNISEEEKNLICPR